MQRLRPAGVFVAAGLVLAQQSAPDTQLRVECVCPITVRGGTGPTVVYSLRNDGTKPRTFAKGGWRWFVADGSASELTVTVPASFHAVIARSRLDVDVRNLNGSAEAETIGGRVFMDMIGGDASARTGGGEIKVGHVKGNVRAVSAGSGISLGQVDGDAWCETSGGEIIIERAGGSIHAVTGGGNIYIRDGGSSVNARSDGGLIDVQHAGGIVDAETRGGSIQVGGAKGARCESAAGAIRIRNLAGALDVRTALGSILTELVPGVPFVQSNLVTGQGDITVLIPSNLAVSIQAMNESRGRLARIISDFPQLRVKTVSSGPTSAIWAEGSLNGGGPLLRINAASGTIYLRRQR
jgi:hypothetical protein